MARYVDGFVIPIAQDRIEEYRAMAKKAAKVWLEHGALQYMECVGDDLEPKPGCGKSFPKIAKAKTGETVIFAFIAYKSRAHRDKVNAKVIADPRLKSMCDPKDMPFDLRRMSYGGFQAIVEG